MKKFRRYPHNSNLFLHQLWYWLCPSGTEGSSLCSLLVLALPKAKRGDESRTSTETVSPEATLELSILLTLISNTQPVSPGPFPHSSSSGPTCGWEVGTWRSMQVRKTRFHWLELVLPCLQKQRPFIFSPSPVQTSLLCLQDFLSFIPHVCSLQDSTQFMLFLCLGGRQPWVQILALSRPSCGTLAKLLNFPEPIVRHEPIVVTSSGCYND